MSFFKKIIKNMMDGRNTIKYYKKGEEGYKKHVRINIIENISFSVLISLVLTIHFYIQRDKDDLSFWNYLLLFFFTVIAGFIITTLIKTLFCFILIKFFKPKD